MLLPGIKPNKKPCESTPAHTTEKNHKTVQQTGDAPEHLIEHAFYPGEGRNPQVLSVLGQYVLRR